MWLVVQSTSPPLDHAYANKITVYQEEIRDKAPCQLTVIPTMRYMTNVVDLKCEALLESKIGSCETV